MTIESIWGRKVRCLKYNQLIVKVKALTPLRVQGKLNRKRGSKLRKLKNLTLANATQLKK